MYRTRDSGSDIVIADFGMYVSSCCREWLSSSPYGSVRSIFILLTSSCIPWPEVSATSLRRFSTERDTGNLWISGPPGKSLSHRFCHMTLTVPSVSSPTCCFAVMLHSDLRIRRSLFAKRWQLKLNFIIDIGQTFPKKVLTLHTPFSL